MEEFKKYLLYQKEIAEHKITTINRFLRAEEHHYKKYTSQIDVVEKLLQIAGRPLHVSEIIEVANRDFHV